MNFQLEEIDEDILTVSDLLQGDLFILNDKLYMYADKVIVRNHTLAGLGHEAYEFGPSAPKQARPLKLPGNQPVRRVELKLVKYLVV